jgi:hypothetical protein
MLSSEIMLLLLNNVFQIPLPNYVEASSYFLVFD